jgi:hypothetical protein
MTKEEFINKYHHSLILFLCPYSFHEGDPFYKKLEEVGALCKKVGFIIIGSRRCLAPRSFAEVIYNGYSYDPKVFPADRKFTREEFEEDIKQIKTI